VDYLKHYSKLVTRAKTRNLEEGIYCEKHHIVPKSEGGLDTEENIVKLTAREHFLAHWLLYRIDPENSSRAYSFWRMCRGRGKVVPENWIVVSSRVYEEARLAHSKAISKQLKGRKKTAEHITKVAEANKGKKRTQEAKTKMSEAAKKRGLVAHFHKFQEKAAEKAEKQKIPVLMLDTATKEVVKTFNSLKEAANFVNRGISNISIAIKKGSKCGNYYWCKYENR
jgi:hypothetical protein